MHPIRIKSRRQLEQAMRQGATIGASLMAGSNFGSKTEREQAGRVLWSLADLLERALAKGFLDPIGMGD